MNQIETAISAVTVYPDRARVTRQGTAAVETGVQQIEIVGLPLTLDEDSARVAARGSARARLLGLQLQRAFYLETPSEHLHQLEEQIEALQDELSELGAKTETAGQAKAGLIAIMAHTHTFARALISGEMNLDGQLALFESLRSRIGDLDQELLDLAIRKRGVERHLAKLKNELDQFRKSPQREAYTAIIEVEVLGAGDLIFELSYVVSGANWQPLYDLRLQENDAITTVEASYLAQVSQRTGEAWDGVSLTLSTTRPALAGKLPELDPWFIRPFTPPVPLPVSPVPRREAMVKAARAPVPEADTFTMAAEEAQPVEAVVDASGSAVTYHVPGTVSIPADGAPRKVNITRVNLEPKLDYVSAPKLVEAAYRRAKIVNDSSLTFLPGPASLFTGEEFIGTSRLDLIPPGGEIEIYLGVDDRLKIAREMKRREVDKKLIGGKKRLSFGYEITVENLLPVLVHLGLQDQMPVARQEEIKVRLESANPAPSEQTELNLLNWELTLQPNEKWSVRFDFSVECPQGMELAGLP